MARKEHTHTAAFKAQVALEALKQNKTNLDRLSDKYNVPVSTILTWTAQLERNAAHSYSLADKTADASDRSAKESVVDVSIDDEEVAESVSYGVMADRLDYRKLTFWSVFGMVLVVIFIQFLQEMYTISSTVNTEQVSENSSFYDVNEQRENQLEKLSTFGVVNIEEGVYRMPIDSVINEMAVDGE